MRVVVMVVMVVVMMVAVPIPMTKKILKNIQLFFCGSFDRIPEPRFLDEDKLPKWTSLRK